MAASKKEDKTRIHIDPIIEYARHNDPGRLNFPGYKFSWVNLNEKLKFGWGIHNPVLRDTELGEAVKEQFGMTGDKYAGQNKETNYFLNGQDAVLAYTSDEILQRLAEQDQAAADRQMASLGDAIKLQRNMVVSGGIKK